MGRDHGLCLCSGAEGALCCLLPLPSTKRERWPSTRPKTRTNNRQQHTAVITPTPKIRNVGDLFSEIRIRRFRSKNSTRERAFAVALLLMGVSEHDGRIKVCCRVRPIGKGVTTPLDVRHRCVVHLQPSSAPTIGSDTATAREGSRARNRRRTRDQWGFTFDDVLEDGSSQEEVYRRCAKDIVQSALAGVNGTIMACESTEKCIATVG